MKKVTIFYLFLFSSFFFTQILTSCDDDGVVVDNYYISIATVRLAVKPSYWLQLDNGKLLWPLATLVPWYNPVDSQRVIASYTLLSGKQGKFDYNIRLNNIRKVLKKSVVDLNNNTPNNDPLRVEDPLRVDDIWIGGGYVNLIFSFRGGNSNMPHYINLLTNSVVNPDNPNADGVWKLELRHNSMGDTGNILFTGIVSFVIPPSIAPLFLKNFEIIYKNLANQTSTITLPFLGKSTWSPVPVEVNELDNFSEGRIK